MSYNDELNNNLSKILNLQNAGGKPLVKKHFEQSNVNLIVDKSISPARFKKHPFLFNYYLVNEVTIRALKKDIFILGAEGFEDLEQLYQCYKCSNIFDLQFWHFCPYCESKIKMK